MDQRVVDFPDRLVDKGGGVVNDAVVQAIDEALLQLLHFVADALRGLDGIGAGKLEDVQGDGGFAVEGAGLIVLLGAELDPSHIAEADDADGLRHGAGRDRLRRGAAAGLDDDVGELFRIGEPAEGVDGELELLALGRRLLTDLAGSHLKVLLADGADDVGRAETQRCEPVGIEPGAQAVVALAEVGDVGDTRQPAQLVANINRGVIAQEGAVVAAVGGNQVHDHQRIGRHFLDRDAFVLHQGRNHRQRQGNAVLHQHLGHVGVHAQVERDQQAVGAVVGRLRRHVHHALDAADLLLDRRRHYVAHRHRVGPGIKGGHQHRGRADLGVLGYRERDDRHAARQHKHDREHGGKDRAIDKKVGNHLLPILRCRAGTTIAARMPAAAPTAMAGCVGAAPRRPRK